MKIARERRWKMLFRFEIQQQTSNQQHPNNRNVASINSQFKLESKIVHFVSTYLAGSCFLLEMEFNKVLFTVQKCLLNK